MNSFDLQSIESRTLELGQQIFDRSRSSIFSSSYWSQRVMDLATRNPRVKTQLFRFVDVLPALKTFEQKKAHLLEYLSTPKGVDQWPLSLIWVCRFLHLPLIDRLVSKQADFQVRKMASQFIVGSSMDEALPRLKRSRRRSLGFTLDVLGEAIVSQKEADSYYRLYERMIEELSRDSQHWAPHSLLDRDSLGEIPRVNLSIKLSALDCKLDPMAFESSVERAVTRLKPLLLLARKKNIFVNLDMEQSSLKELTRATFRNLLLCPELCDYRHLGIVVQAYLRSSETDIQDWIQIAHLRKTPFQIRLVKGAYWDYEVIQARQNGWEIPVFLTKSETDENFEKCARLLLESYPHIQFAVGSHNLRSIAYVLALCEAHQLSTSALEFQMLFGMADPFKKALTSMNLRVREYSPVGEFLPGLSYLVRRLLENTANDSFLKQAFLDGTEIKRLLMKR